MSIVIDPARRAERARVRAIRARLLAGAAIPAAALLLGASPAMATPPDTTISTAVAGPLVVNTPNLTITSTGAVNSSGTAVVVSNPVGTVSNDGMISGVSQGVYASNSVAAIVNTGTITSTGSGGNTIHAGINNSNGSIGTISNGGLISGVNGSGIFNDGSIDAISITGGTIGGGTVSGGSKGIANGSSGWIGAIVNTGTIISTATNSSSAAAVMNNGSIGTIDNSGVITANAAGIYNVSARSISSIVNQSTGTIHSDGSAAISNSGSIGTITNLGLIAGTSGIGNGATITQITNAAGASIIGNSNRGISNGSVIDAISNSGVISSAGYGIINDGGNAVIGVISNSGTIAGGVIGIGNNHGSMQSIANIGAGASIIGVTDGISNSDSIGTISNAGVIHGGSGAGISASGTIGMIDNQAGGVISGVNGVLITANGSGANIGSIANAGTITGTQAALKITGASTSSSSNTVSFGQITNTGMISGNIVNATTQDLAIAGGEGAVFGTLTGLSGAVGTISNTTSNLAFSGNLLLDDHIDVGANAITSTGVLQINRALNITAGGFTQTGGALNFGVTSAASYGQLVFGSAATVRITGASMGLIPLTTGVLATGQNYTVVSNTAGTTTITNDTVTIQGFTGTLTNTGHNVVLSVLDAIATTPTPSPTPAPTPAGTFTSIGQQAGGAAIGTGAALDAIIKSNTPAAQAFTQVIIPVLSALPSAQQAKALEQLSPGPVALQLSSGATAPITAAIGGRQSTFAAVASGQQYASLGSDDYYGEGSATGRALWGKLLGGGATRSESSAGAAYHASVFGAVVGADLVQAKDVYAGAAFSWAGAWANAAGNLAGSNTRLNSYQITGYGSWLPSQYGGRLSVDGQLGFGYNQFNQSRQISFLNATARSSFNGQQYLGAVTVGYAFQSRKLTVTPYAGISEAHLVNAGYTESGAGLANLAVKGQSTDTFQHDIGVKLSGAWDVTGYGQVLPSLKLGWGHTYDNGPIATSGTLAGITFASSSARPSADGALIGAGATLLRGDGVRIGLEYQGDVRKDFQSHTGAVRVTMKF